MDKNGKGYFISDLIENIKKEIYTDFADNKFPEEWDGVELRWLIKEKFNQVVLGGYHNKRSKRWKDFKNHCIVNNLF